MKPHRKLIPACLVLLASLASCATGQAPSAGAAPPPGPGPATVTVVHAHGVAFEPPNLTVKAGATVRWVSDDSFHTVTPEDPAQPGGWERAGVFQGEAFEHTFRVAGTFRYFCEPHVDSGMVGTITVVP